MNPFSDVMKDAVNSVYEDINEGTEKFRKSFDLLGRFQKRHSNKVADSLRLLQILGMGKPRELSNLYIPTKATERIRRNFYISEDELDEMLSSERQPIDPYKYLEDKRRVIVLGGAGAGKTTFLSAYVLGQLKRCEASEKYINTTRLPIYLSLRELAEIPIELLTMVKRYLRGIDENDAYPFVEKMIKKGNAVLCFDGLDEVSEESQIAFHNCVAKFLRINENARIVIAARTASFLVDFNGFHHIELLPFAEDDVVAFIREWFKEGQVIANELLSILSRNSKIQDLTTKPLLLSLLCNLYESDLDISNNRTELYSRCIEVLLVRWDTFRGFRRKSKFSSLDLGVRKRLLQIAANRLSKTLQGAIRDKILESIVAEYLEKVEINSSDAGAILDELEAHHSLLIRPAANYWKFSHISFQDYFNAEYIKSCRKELDYLRNHWSEVRHRDCIVFLGSLLEDGDSFLTELLSLSDPRNLQAYPSIAKRLSGVSLLVRLLSQGITISPNLRKEAMIQIIGCIEYTVNHFSKTGIKLFSYIENEQLMISYVYWKRRNTTWTLQRQLLQTCSEISDVNYSPINVALDERISVTTDPSVGLVLCGCILQTNYSSALGHYRRICEGIDDYGLYKKMVTRSLNRIEAYNGEE